MIFPCLHHKLALDTDAQSSKRVERRGMYKLSVTSGGSGRCGGRQGGEGAGVREGKQSGGAQTRP